jgi:hypothetical protein
MAELLAAGGDLGQELAAVAEQLGQGLARAGQDRSGRRPGEGAIAGDGRRVEPVGPPGQRRALPEDRLGQQARGLGETADPRRVDDGGLDPPLGHVTMQPSLGTA